MEAIAVVLAAGRGLRLGANLPKAHVRVAGGSLLQWSAAALARAPGVSGVLPVVGPDSAARVAEIGAGWKGPARLLDAVQGGEERQDSVAAGLRAIEAQAPDAEWVLVHDAARCLVTPAEAAEALAAAQATGAALLVAPVEDTLKRVEDDRVTGTLDRGALVRALTPQVFRVALLRQALERAEADGFRGTDCSSLVERMGVEVRTCPGRAENFKVTSPPDLERAEAILRRRAAEDVT
ncbi:MAG: 2-C-methyl-D-erythritol 4-phosphate cytidylyltransferase [Deltaproteobacteria bacterium]|nr:2-C-methyl-D-erythritol 4-phosphate cytidylyltransferase [Deltaproteobacteria bacterium]MBW2414027.1 2-C-methyl-D-erythritol 4-phosphate cytidylyltransferase [Deltaproteobacteria bacterium]